MSTIPDLKAKPGNTPLHPDDADKLIPPITTVGQLDEWERTNILRAQRWAFNPRVMRSRNPLEEIYLRDLHRRMFDEVWKWAGEYRTREVNIGCAPNEIVQRIAVFLGNVEYWVEHNSYAIDEIAVRFHHKLVGTIHAFPSGNGRHARLLANVVVVKHGRPRFTWGRANLGAAAPAREVYFNALRALDENDNNIQPLLEFARA